MGLRRVDTLRPGITQKSVSGQRDIERVGLCGAPLQGRLIYSNSRVHGNRTLGVCIYEL